MIGRRGLNKIEKQKIGETGDKMTGLVIGRKSLIHFWLFGPMKCLLGLSGAGTPSALTQKKTTVVIGSSRHRRNTD